MTTKFVAGCIFAFVLLSIIFMVVEGEFDPDPIQAKLLTLTRFQVIEIHQLWGFIKFPMPNFTYFGVIIEAVTWNYPMLGHPPGLYFKWIFLYPITGATVFGMFGFLLSGLNSVIGRP